MYRTFPGSWELDGRDESKKYVCMHTHIHTHTHTHKDIDIYPYLCIPFCVFWIFYHMEVVENIILLFLSLCCPSFFSVGKPYWYAITLNLTPKRKAVTFQRLSGSSSQRHNFSLGFSWLFFFLNLRSYVYLYSYMMCKNNPKYLNNSY